VREKLALSLLELRIPLLIEKPIADNADTARQIALAGQNFKTLVAVAYQMRCLPLMQAIKSHIVSGTVGRPLSIRVSVGQYLPAWRPGADYRTSVSARADLGGGVLLELSHEIDYILWLFGMPKSVTAKVKRIGDLEIDVADFAEILLNYGDAGPLVSLHLDFLDQMPSRTCRIVGAKGTLFANLISGELSINSFDDPSICRNEDYLQDRNQAYLEILRRFLASVEGANSELASAVEAASVLEIVEAVSRSSFLGQTVKLG
jgi:predicted dehydrogenase